jgi:two-component sensor histidine kinase
VAHQLAPYNARDNIIIESPKIALTAAVTEAVAMVLYELVTNAVKYGALSTPKGRVSVTWAAEPEGKLPEGIVIKWREMDGPRVTAPERRSYGTNLIRNLIPHEIGGAVDLVFKAEGVSCTITLPIPQLAARDWGP